MKVRVKEFFFRNRQKGFRIIEKIRELPGKMMEHFRKDKNDLCEVWKNKMDSFSKKCIIGGFVMFCALPFFEYRYRAGAFDARVLYPMLFAVANGMFIAGIMDFLECLHKFHEKRNGETMKPVPESKNNHQQH